MKNLNKVYTILDIKVKKHIGGYAICYVEKMLTKFKYLEVKEANNL